MYRDQLNDILNFAKQGPGRTRQDQAEQLSKSRKKFLATTYKLFSISLYSKE